MATGVQLARKAYLDSSSGEVIWGVTDCATSAADAIKAATGVDHWALYRGRYQDRQTLQNMTRCSVGQLVQRFAKGSGWKGCDGLSGLCIGLVRGEQGHAIAMGFDGKWLSRGGLGVVTISTNRIIKSWRVC